MFKRVNSLIKKHKSIIDLLLGISYIYGVSYYIIGGIYICKFIITKLPA